MLMVAGAARSEFKQRLEALIQRLEAWSYADSDAGAGVPVEIAREIRQLAALAPGSDVQRRLARALDALDDGLSAETVAAELYGARAELNRTAG